MKTNTALVCPSCEEPMIPEDKHDDPHGSFTCYDCCALCADAGLDR